jgi:hypothetical protein
MEKWARVPGSLIKETRYSPNLYENIRSKDKEPYDNSVGYT